ncbi:hypothetical protein BU14_0200s0029 [Porphyra umbilicalis]|uniref:amino-acid N-acetyltransferase n=1 Tax=Porphyra umbilicalis TaxID=2786 RepID=A0A1X6P6A5_PORUM|nr:hypothetical protein BU14_0200s0029 [Porphyra umbilicalis]|eukprot:OSX76275.1 hypothetical protein BU14_0200s0029 [Porphyra umbilicalis]
MLECAMEVCSVDRDEGEAAGEGGGVASAEAAGEGGGGTMAEAAGDGGGGTTAEAAGEGDGGTTTEAAAVVGDAPVAPVARPAPDVPPKVLPASTFQPLPGPPARDFTGLITETRVDESFVRSFRMSSPYISTHRSAVFVIHLPGALIREPLFHSVMQDVALLHVVGVRLVLVFGAREQIDERLTSEAHPSSMGPTGVRITDGRTLQVAKEAVGAVRIEVEAALARGVVNTPEGNGRSLSVICGNFYAARPVGVIAGEDYGFTGRVRRVEVDAIRRRLEAGDLLLVSSLGLSPSGQVFNCQSESVAAATAAQLSADKLIYLTAGEAVVDVRNGSMVQNLPLSSAVDFLAVHSAGTATASESDPSEAAAAPVDDLPDVFRLCLTESVGALKAGVRRAHLLNRFIDGVLLMEIFHRDGVGFMISRDLYEGIRAARMDDVAGIVEVIRPLEEAGILVPRSRASLEGAIGDFTVVERDGMIIACVSLTIAADEPQAAELGCFAVRPEYRKLGKGDALLGFIERKSYALGVRRLFILSTQSFHWFLERGFEEISVERVPESKRVKVDRSRKSKVYQKLLLGGRAVDEQELLKHL